MKKNILKLVLLLLPLLVLAGCVKQKNCENCVTGKWIYLQEPYAIVGYTTTFTVVAHFYEDGSLFYNPLRFIGKVPPKFMSKDTLHVCLTTNFIGGDLHAAGGMSLNCIEKIK